MRRRTTPVRLFQSSSYGVSFLKRLEEKRSSSMLWRRFERTKVAPEALQKVDSRSEPAKTVSADRTPHQPPEPDRFVALRSVAVARPSGIAWNIPWNRFGSMLPEDLLPEQEVPQRADQPPACSRYRPSSGAVRRSPSTRSWPVSRIPRSWRACSRPYQPRESLRRAVSGRALDPDGAALRDHRTAAYCQSEWVGPCVSTCSERAGMRSPGMR